MCPSDFREFGDFVERDSRTADLGTLRKWIGVASRVVREVVREKPELSFVFPFLGFLGGCEKRGAFTWRGTKGSPLKFRLVGRFLTLGAGMYLWGQLTRQYPARPGWNDLYMVRWFVAGDRDDVACLYWRARMELPLKFSDDAYCTKASCLWMLRSVRARNPELDAVLKTFEAIHGSLEVEALGLAMTVHPIEKELARNGLVTQCPHCFFVAEIPGFKGLCPRCGLDTAPLLASMRDPA